MQLCEKLDAFLTTGNKKLASALVASGVALCWKEGKRPASKAIGQRPQKSLENEGGKGQYQEGKGGAAHLKEQSRAGTTEEVSKSMRTQDVVSVGRSPGLRAYRVVGSGSRSSHGTSEDGQDVEKDQPKAAGAAASDGSSTPFPVGRSLFSDVSSFGLSATNPSSGTSYGHRQLQEG